MKFGLLRPLAKRIGRDHDLAQRLRRSGNSDARLLACMVADPERTTEVELDAWLADIDTYFLVDTFVAELASKAPGRRERAGRWIASERDRTAEAGWDLLNAEALGDSDAPDAWFGEHLALIADRIEGYGNWTRRAASNAITGVGLRNDRL